MFGFLFFFWTISTTPGIYKVFTGVNDTGDKFFADVVDTAEQLITSVVDTGDKHNLRISPRIFEKIQKGSNGILGGLGDTDSWKKTWSRKISCQTPFKVTNLLALINLFPVGCMLGVTKNIYFVEWWPGTILFPVVQIKLTSQQDCPPLQETLTLRTPKFLWNSSCWTNFSGSWQYVSKHQSPKS